jgi:hypothetical protein
MLALDSDLHDGQSYEFPDKLVVLCLNLLPWSGLYVGALLIWIVFLNRVCRSLIKRGG